MYIGFLEFERAPEFFHSGVKVPFAPKSSENGTYTFECDGLFNYDLDVSISLKERSYIGAVCFTVPDATLRCAELFVDGTLSARRASDIYPNYLGGEISLPVGVSGDELVLRLSLYSHSDITLSDIHLLGAVTDENPLIYPTPKSVKFLGKTSKIKSVSTSCDDIDEIYVKNFLKESLTEKLGDWQSECGVDVVIEKDASYKDERYTVSYASGKIVIKAASRLTLLYGADTLTQTASQNGVALAEVDDRPSMKMRGFHFGLPPKRRMEFAKRLFRYVLLPMRYNVVFMEFAGGMRFDSHPEISEAWLRAIDLADKGLQPYMPHSDKVSGRTLLEKADVKDLIDYIKELGFVFIPEVQSLSHVQFITYAHPDIAERVESAPKAAPGSEDGGDDSATFADFYEICYCPSNEKSYKITFDLLDEIIELSQPSEYVLIGHDEADHVGLCPRCKGKDPGDLFANHATRIYNYLKERGLKCMMWADNLQPPPVTRYPTASAREKLPRDIVLLDFIWYFRLNMDTEDYLLSHDYKVAVGNLYSSHFPRYKARIMKEGMVGGELSMWLMADEEIYAECGKMFEMQYLSEMLWNTENYEADNRRTYSDIIAKYIQPRLRDGIRGKLFGKGYDKCEISFSGDSAKIPAELLTLAPKTALADSVMANVDGKFERLVFEHSTLHPAPRITWQPTLKIGDYIITYEDGESVCAEVRYAKNTLIYKSSYGEPMPDNYYRHMGYVGTWLSDPVKVGKNALGEDMTTYGFVFENPHPDKTIKSIGYKACEGDYTQLAVSGIYGLNKVK